MVKKLVRPLAKPINRKMLKKELTAERFLRSTRMGGNKVFVFDGIDAPHLMKEVGRLRELTFRDSGAGIGLPIDIDQHDTGPNNCKQLIVWNPVDKEIIGGYRFNTFEKYQNQIKKTIPVINKQLYDFDPEFEKIYAPYFIELTRAFIQPKYQQKNKKRVAVFSLDNIWDGLGAVLAKHHLSKYFFGRLIIYPSYDPFMRDLLFFFFKKHLCNKNMVLRARHPYEIDMINHKPNKYLKYESADVDFRELQKIARERNLYVPPLISAYYRASNSMVVFEPVIDHHFGNCFSAAMMITIKDIKPNLIKRYVNPYKKHIQSDAINNELKPMS